MFNFLLFTWIFFLGLGQFANLHQDSFGGFYLFDIFSLVWTVFTLIFLLVSKKSRFIIPKIYFWFFAFDLWNIISLLIASQRFSYVDMTYAFFYFIRLNFYVIGGLCIYNVLKQNLLSTHFLTKCLTFFALFLCLSGFIQLTIFPNFSVLDSSLGWDPHINRLLGTLFDPNYMGATLVLCFNILLSHHFSIGRKNSGILVIILVAIFLTFSRSAWLMLSVSIFIWGVLKYRFLLFVSLAVAFLAYFAVPRVQTRISSITDPADSAHFRIISWKNTLKIAGDNLIFGTGYNTFRFVQKDYGYLGVDWGGRSGGGADSSLLLVLATTGVLGLLLFLLFFFSPLALNLVSVDLKNFDKKYPMRANTANSWKMALITSFPALLVNSFFINSLFYPQILFLWNLILAGFIFSCTER